MTKGGLTRYFESIAYKPIHSMGDRMFGHWNGIPFVGSVGNDRSRNDGPECTIHLDLPIKYEEVIYNVIVVKHDQIKPLKEI